MNPPPPRKSRNDEQTRAHLMENMHADTTLTPAHRRGVFSAVLFIPMGTFLGFLPTLCFKCFLSALTGGINNGRRTVPTLVLDTGEGLASFDPMTESLQRNAGDTRWLRDIRPAQNCCEQNVEISLITCKLPESAGQTEACGCAEHEGTLTGPLRLRALKDITLGEELFAWPDLLLGLSIGLPFLTPKHIKSPICYQCPKCGASFSQPNSLKGHLFLGNCDEEETKSPPLPLATGTTPTSLRIQTPSTSPTPRHLCTFCGRRYARRYSLVIHQRTHTGQKPLECRVCGRRFGDPSNLNKHLRTHGVGAVGGRGEKGGVTNPYVCRLCGNVSTRRRDFDRHMSRKHGVQ